MTIETGFGNGGIYARVTDSGPGIPPQLIGRVFEPFFTTKREKGGTGLGLSMAKKIVQQNKRRIDVASEEGKGTAFTIALPV